MRVGLTLAGAHLNEDGAQFAAQLGVTDIVARLTNYQGGGDQAAYLAGKAAGPAYGMLGRLWLKLDGVLIPDHVPELKCSAPWHAGHAYTVGYMRALINNVQSLGR